MIWIMSQFLMLDVLWQNVLVITLSWEEQTINGQMNP